MNLPILRNTIPLLPGQISNFSVHLGIVSLRFFMPSSKLWAFRLVKNLAALAQVFQSMIDVQVFLRRAECSLTRISNPMGTIAQRRHRVQPISDRQSV